MPIKIDDNLNPLTYVIFTSSGRIIDEVTFKSFKDPVTTADDNYAVLPRTETIEINATMTKIDKTLFYLLVLGGDKRKVRLAIRWEEKLRRMELKSGKKIFTSHFDRKRTAALIVISKRHVQ